MTLPIKRKKPNTAALMLAHYRVARGYAPPLRAARIAVLLAHAAKVKL